MSRRQALLLLGFVVACSAEQASPPGAAPNGPTQVPGTPAPGVASDCGTVRMTQYAATARRWCGFDRTNPVLPDFVRAGMTVAIAEPYNGSSYSGAAGEACGECWELTTSFASQTVMVHDLCPIEGNPACAGGYFHFDVSTEVAAAITGGDSLGTAALHRAPCPVTGDIFAYVSDRNAYGYLKLAFFNHRYPIRTVEYQALGTDTWLPMQRCLARWCVEGDKSTFAADGPGALLRLTSANGNVVIGSRALTSAVATASDFDTGAQFPSPSEALSACRFAPPGSVYDEAWGGIDGVGWEPNTWGSVQLSETATGCADASASCLLLQNFGDSGLHATYRHAFPLSTFSTLTLALRSISNQGTVEVAPRSADARCPNPTRVGVTSEWIRVQIDIAATCPGIDAIQGLTISRPSGPMDLMLDEIRFQ